MALPSPCLAQPSIKVDVHLVNVTFSVRDAGGKPAGNLTRDDFEVLEDGVPQTISFFGRQNDIPLTLGLIIDASGSQDHVGKEHARDLQSFLQSTLEPKDRAFLVCFGNRVRLASDFSDSPAQLIAALKKFDKGERGGMPELGPKEDRDLGTAFYDSIFYSIQERLAGPVQGRRALLMFSDGEDNSSSHNMLEAIEAAQTADVLFFGLRYTESKKGRLNARNKYGIGVMKRLAEMTGGADFDARAGLAAAFSDIAEQLRTSYEIAYHSSNSNLDPGFRKLTIRVKKSNFAVRAKTGYYVN